MDLFIADDSKQTTPSRPRMGPLVATGGIHVPGNSVRVLERRLEALCTEYGFPAREPFKWSPGRELWMRTNLVEEQREEFFGDILNAAREVNVRATVVVEDTQHSRAIADSASPEIDVTRLLIERVDQRLRSAGSFGLMIVDRPGGGRAEEERFLGTCMETIQSGTAYVQPERISLSVLSSPSKLIRLIQLADVVTGCTTAVVAGDRAVAQRTFESIRPLLARENGRAGGCGLKIHPDYTYVNLYHWLLGDTHFNRRNTGIPLPMETRPYSGDPFTR